MKCYKHTKYHIHCNLYANGPQAKGLQPHSDACPVVVIQMAGEESNGILQITKSLRMKPGDILWIPEGLGHYAEAVSDPSKGVEDQISFHLTCGIRKSIQEGWTKKQLHIVLDDDSDLWPIENGVFVRKSFLHLQK